MVPSKQTTSTVLLVLSLVMQGELETVLASG